MTKGTPEWDKVLSKVKKLLALGTSPVEAEAESAMAKAGELMAKYNMTIADTKTEEEIKSDCGELKVKGYGDYSARSGATSWQVRLASGIARAFEAEIIIQPDWDGGFTLVFVGMQSDVITAKWFFDYVRRWIQYEANQIRKGSQAPGAVRARNSFCTGAKDVVVRRIQDMYKHMREAMNAAGCTSLVVVKENAIVEFEEKNYPNLRKTSYHETRSDSAAYSRGREEGKKIPLSKQVGRKRGESSEPTQQIG